MGVLSVLLVLFLTVLAKLTVDFVLAGTRMLLGMPFFVGVVFESGRLRKLLVDRLVLEFYPLIFHIILGDVSRQRALLESG